MPPSPSRELIPYSASARQVYFRHKNSVVIFDPEQDRPQQLTACHIDGNDRLQHCPLCRRAFTDGGNSSAAPTNSADDLDDAFVPDVNPGYFRMLAQSRHVSPQTSAPSTPKSRFPSLPSSSSGSLDSTTHAQAREHDHARGRISSSAFTQGYFERFFVQERELGRGGKAVVLLVRHVLDGVFLGRFACKRIPVGDDRKWLENVLTEVTLLQDVSHKNLVAYRHVWLEDFQSSPFTPKVPHLYILQQYCNAGTLFQHVLSNASPHLDRLRKQPSFCTPQGLGFDQAFTFFKDITTGLAYLHSRGFVHRDLKPQNCLLHGTDGSLRALVSDFGEMQRVTVERGPFATGYTGTISFSAPEVVTRRSNGTFGDFSTKSDVFSLGMIVYFMCFARLPYASSDERMREENEDVELLRAEISAWAGFDAAHRERADLPEKLYRYLRTLLSRDPDQRPTTDAILQAIKGGSASNEHTAASSRSSTNDSPSDTNGTALAREYFSRTGLTSTSASASASESASGSILPSEMYLFERSHALEGKDASPASPQLLLPAPRPGSIRINLSFATLLTLLPGHALESVKLLVFLLKTWSLLAPCADSGYNLAALYPLFLLAAMDLALFKTIQGSLALTVLHTAILVALRQRDRQCLVTSQESWSS